MESDLQISDGWSCPTYSRNTQACWKMCDTALPGRWEEIKDAIEGREDEYKNGQGKEKGTIKLS